MHELRMAERMGRLGTETAFEVLARARALEARGHSVVHLEIGEPDFDTPQFIKDAAVEALAEGFTHYTPAPGLPQVREVIADYVARTRGISVEPAQVVVTPGAKPIMFYLLLALINNGDEVVYQNPGYPIYESMIKFAGGVPVPLVLRESNGFRVDPRELRSLVTRRTKLIITNSPHNPCGSVLSRDEVRAIAEVVASSDALWLSDEIYSRIIYDGVFASPAGLPGMEDRLVILDGFSKTYAMTGWRLGYGVMRRDLAERLTQLQINATSCAAAFVQMAGAAALRGPQDEVEAMVAEFRRRRDVITDGLNRIEGISCLRPGGTFYVFPNVSAVDPDGRAFADHLLTEGGVATLAGTAFGAHGRGYLRISYANSLANIEEALRRIERSVATFRATRV